jgi:hypothetical protein
VCRVEKTTVEGMVRYALIFLSVVTSFFGVVRLTKEPYRRHLITFPGPNGIVCGYIRSVKHYIFIAAAPLPFESCYQNEKP